MWKKRNKQGKPTPKKIDAVKKDVNKGLNKDEKKDIKKNQLKI
jgi:hypothetical protein